MKQSVGGYAGSAMRAGVSFKVSEGTAGLGHDERGRSEVPQGNLRFGGDIYCAFGDEAIGPEVSVAAQAPRFIR